MLTLPSPQETPVEETAIAAVDRLRATAVAPSWDQIGKLAAIAAMRTALNDLHSREMAEGKS